MTLSRKRILITAGPTREMLDPVRFLSNRSSGKMAYALAQAALDKGAIVTLVSGPVSLTAPENARLIPIISADDMLNAVMNEINETDIFIACAAVSDYKPAKIALQKIKKTDDALTLQLVRTPDILKTVASLKNKPFCVGFAAETNNLEEYALKKLKEKKLDMIIANEVSFDKGFESDVNTVTLYSKNEEGIYIDTTEKTKLAEDILSEIEMRSA